MTTSAKNIFEEKKLGKAQDLRLLKKLYPFIKPYRVLFAATLVLIILITGLELTIPYITKIAIDRYIVPENISPIVAPDISPDISPEIKPDTHRPYHTRHLEVDGSNQKTAKIINAHPALFQTDGTSAYIAYEDLPELNSKTIFQLRKKDITGVSLAAAVLLIIVIISFGLNFGKVILMEYAGQMMMHDLRIKLFSHIQQLSVHFFTKNPVGRLVTRVTNDTQNMHEMFTSVLVFVVKDLFMLAGITVVLFSIDWQLSVAVYTVFPLVFYASYKFSKAARGAFRTLRIKMAEINSKFSETIGGMQVIQLFGREQSNLNQFKRINKEHYNANMQQVTIFALFMPIIEMMSSVALAVVIFHGGESLIAHRITLGTLVVFISYIKMFFRPIRDIAEKYNITLNALSSAERLFLIFEDTDRLPEADAAHRALIPAKMDSILFDNVSFSYVAGEKVLKNISFEVHAGETVAIVGPTGAGKTSIVNLMIRFYDPDSGNIQINKTDIRQFVTADIRSKTAIVMQDPYLFSGSIKDNIFTKHHQTTKKEINAVLDASCCRSLIEKLPRGIDSELSESGATLSSGERQLISIARALAHNPDLIIFDEATSYIDSETEDKIQNALANLMKNRTSVIIAHRLSTSRIADRIMVLRSGRIIETGTHRELIDQKGFYYRLNQLQG